MTPPTDRRDRPLIDDTLPTWWWPLAIGWVAAATAWLAVWLAEESTGGTLAAPAPGAVRADWRWPCWLVGAAWIAALMARLWLPAGTLLLGLVSLGGLALVLVTIDRTGPAWSVAALLGLIAPGLVLSATAIRHLARLPRSGQRAGAV